MPARTDAAHGKAAPNPALLFSALGDETRLWLVERLAAGQPRSIAELTDGSQLTRQAITKHLRVLQDAGMVRSVRAGRESRFEFEPGSLAQAQAYLQQVSAQWDRTLGRLKAFVEG
jgi:DNA-binding transcriptional ArsR family regulator